MKLSKYNGNHFNRKYHVNHDFFKKWSRDMAYVLGFWYADGCIIGNKFFITQHKKEKPLIKKILKAMGANYPLNSNHNTYFFAISSRTIVESIKKIGGTERKSLTIKFPHVPKKYLPDFIRGLWDGDGCVDKKFYKASIVSGSKRFIKELHRVLKTNIPGIKGKIKIVIIKKGTIFFNKAVMKKDGIYYYLCFETNETKKLRDFMYQKNCNIMMKRKYKLFKESGAFKPAFISFKKCRKFVQSLGIKSETEWRVYRENRPNNIPSSPEITYKYNGWNGWTDFLGTQPLKLWGYKKAKNYVKKLNLKSISEWTIYARSPNKLVNLTLEPHRHYKNSGWVDWWEWLGLEKTEKIYHQGKKNI